MKCKKRIGMLCAVIFSVALVFLAGCSADLEEKKNSSSGAYGSIIIEGFDRKVDVAGITKAEVTVSGYGMESLSKETSVSGGKGSVTIEMIPVGKNRIVTVQAYGVSEKIDGIILRAAADISEGENSVSVE